MLQQHQMFNVYASSEEDEYIMDVEDFAPSVIEKLKAKKLNIKSLKTMKLSELANYIEEPFEVCANILKYVKGENSFMKNKLLQGKISSPMKPQQGLVNNISLTQVGSHSTLARLEQESTPSRFIKTFCKDLDDALGGFGIKTGIITDICGVPGVGKTQCVMQLAVDVQMPSVFEGIDGECIYIDTEGSFTIERTKEIGEAFITHLNGIASKRGDTDLTKKDEMMEVLNNFTIEKILSSIYYYRVMSIWELTGLLLVLPEFLKSHTKVKLIVVDSIAFHLRKSSSDDTKDSLKKSIAQSLSDMAKTFDLAVVTTNQVTTKFAQQQGDFSNKKIAYVAPALNHLWVNQVTTSIFMEFVGSGRFARLVKGYFGKDVSIPFRITPAGFRGLPPQPKTIADEVNASEEPSASRQNLSSTDYSVETDANNKRKRK